jgi:hypothetical protein
VWSLWLACRQPEPEPAVHTCETEVDCDDGDLCTANTCEEGNCRVELVVCEEAPPSICLDEVTVRSYNALGTCGGGECDYAPIDTSCTRSCLGGQCVDAPSGELSWLVPLLSPSTVTDPTVAALSDGDLLVEASVYDSVEVGGSSIVAAGMGSVFARVSPDGAVRWARPLLVGPSGEIPYNLITLAGSEDGAMYVGGLVAGDIELVPGSPSQVHLPEEGRYDALIARLDADGNPGWALRLGGDPEAFVLSMAALPDGGVVASGSYQGGLEELGLPPLEAPGTWVARFTAEGALVWAWSAPAGDRALVAARGEHIYAAGQFGETFSLPSGQILEALERGNIYLVSLSLEGEVQWTDQISNEFPYLWGLAAHSDGSVAMGGSFGFGPMRLSPGTPQEASLEPWGSSDAWYSVWSADGVRQRERVVTGGPDSSSLVQGLAWDDEGGLWLAGQADGSEISLQDLGSEPVVLPKMSPDSDDDIFYARYDAQGALVTAQAAGGSAFDEGRSVAWASGQSAEGLSDLEPETGTSRRPAVAATFQSRSVFGRGEPGETELVSESGANNAVLLGLSP